MLCGCACMWFCEKMRCVMRGCDMYCELRGCVVCCGMRGCVMWVNNERMCEIEITMNDMLPPPYFSGMPIPSSP